MDPEREFEGPRGTVKVRRHGLVFAAHFANDLVAADMDAYSAWQRERLGPGEDFVSFSLLLGVQKIPEDVRQATGRYMVEFGPRTRASATVIQADGFAGAAGRAMTSGFYLLTRAGFPRKVFADLPSAEAWLAPYMESLDDLRDSAAYLRAVTGS